WVRTSDKSFARLRFPNGYLDVSEDTAIIVDSALAVDTGVVVGVAEGPQQYVVRAADGTQARMGAVPGESAEFRLTPWPTTKGLEIAVTKGSMVVAGSDGERRIGAGEATDLAQQHTSAI